MSLADQMDRFVRRGPRVNAGRLRRVCNVSYLERLGESENSGNRVIGVILAASLLVPVGCGGAERRTWGEPVDVAAATPLSELLSGHEADLDGFVTVSGRIGEVCRSAGCWFVLQDTGDGRIYEVLVDLKPRATFTVPPSVQGSRAVVSGHLVGKKPDLQLQAEGLVVE